MKTQLEALHSARNLKLNQLKIKISQLNNKLTGEEAELTAATNELKLSEDQFKVAEKMYEEGLVSLYPVSAEKYFYQNAVIKNSIRK